MARPPDHALSVAAIGSGLLAIPGLYGTWMGGVMLLMMWSPPPETLPEWSRAAGGTVFLLSLIGIGFYLLVGYWRLLVASSTVPHGPPFWLLSGAYNLIIGLYISFLAVVRPSILLTGSWPLTVGVILSLAWTTFMSVLGIRRGFSAVRRWMPGEH
jgi:uncharacterized protein YacL